MSWKKMWAWSWCLPLIAGWTIPLSPFSQPTNLTDLWLRHVAPEHEAILRAEIQLVKGHVPLTNFLEFQFYGIVGIGTPSQQLRICFDTGSSDFWVPSTSCDQCAGHVRLNATQSTTFEWMSPNAMSNFTVQYGSGQATGNVGMDTMTVGEYRVEKVSFGVVTTEQAGLNRMKADGLLGLAFDGLSTFSHPPLFQQLFEQYPDVDPVFSVYLSPEPGAPGSELVIGGMNPMKVKSGAEWLEQPVLPQIGLWTFWRVQIHSMLVGKQFEACAAGCVAIVDTGTSLLGIPMGLYMGVLNAIAETTRENGCLCALTIYGYQCFLCHENAFPTLRIGLSNKHFFLLHGTDYVMCQGTTCLPLIQPAGQGMWILGDVFLKKYYTMFDMKAKTVSFSCVVEDEELDDYDQVHCGYETRHHRYYRTVISNALHLDDLDAHMIIVLFFSGLSMVGSAFIIGSFWHYPALRQKRVLAMVFWLSLCNFMYNLQVWIAGVARFPDTSSFCAFQSVIQQLIGVSIILYSAVISIELLRAFRGHQSETKDYSTVYHTGIWAICVLISVFCSGFDVIGQVPDLDGPDIYCWIGRTPGWARLIFFYIPVLATMLLSIYAVKYALCRLHETTLLRTESGRRSAQLLISYVVVFILSYLFAIILGLMSLFHLHRPLWLGYLNEICFYSQGILNCFVWAFSPSFREAYQTKYLLDDREVECLLPRD